MPNNDDPTSQPDPFGDEERPDDEEQPAQSTPDPFDDLESLRVTNWEEVEVEEVVTSLKVRKPKPREFFRVHPDESYTFDLAIYEHEVNSFDKTAYMVTPDMVRHLAAEVVPARVFVCMNRQGETFLFPAKLPSADGGGRDWRRSALAAVELAKASWTKMSGKNKGLGRYEVSVAKGDLGEPQWRKEPMKELLKLGFQDTIIDSPDHPVVKELKGEQ